MPLSIVPLPLGFSLLKLVSLVLGVAFIGHLLLGKSDLRFNSAHMFLALYVIYTTTSLLHFIDDNSWANVRGMLETSLIIFLITTRNYSRKEISLIIQSWMVVGVLTIIMSLIGSVAYGGERESLLLLGGIEDPNQLCGYLILPLLLYIKNMMKKSRFMPLYILLIIVISYIVLKTGSRGGLIAIVIPVFLYTLLSLKSFKRIAILLLSMLLVVFAFIYIVYPSLPEDVRARYSVENVVEDGGSGRFEIWKTTYNSIIESDSSIIFGKGIGSTVKILSDAGIKNTVAHNHWLQIWCDQGLIGLILFTLLILACFFRIYKRQQETAIALIGMLALAMSLTLYAFYKPFWNIILMSALNCEEDILR